MKAQWKDKYLEICESTLQSPGSTIVKGALLSHLKLNVSPIVEASGQCGIVSGNKGKKSNAKNSLFQRKRCYRNSDKRSISSQHKSIEYFENEIKEPVYEELDMLTSDGYLIPEELKETIRKARSESHQKLELDKYLRESGLPRRPIEDIKPQGDLSDCSEGTYITISYRDSAKGIKVASDKIHRYVEVEPRLSRNSSACDDDEDESPYSVVCELKDQMSHIPHYLIIEEDCSHGLDITECPDCKHYYTKLTHTSISDSSETDTESLHQYSSSNSMDRIPATYLKRSVAMTDSSSTTCTTNSFVVEEDVFTETSEPVYYSLEETKELVAKYENRDEGYSEEGVKHAISDNNNNTDIIITETVTYL